MKRFRKYYLVVLSLLSLILVSCAGSYDTEFQFNFSFDEDEQGWTTGFAD